MGLDVLERVAPSYATVGSRAKYSRLLLPQLISLDTPCVFLAWQAIFAVTFGIRISTVTWVVGAACVWMIYAADHLLDVQRGAHYSERHLFLREHKQAFTRLLIAVLSITVALAFFLPPPIITGGFLLAAVVCGYMLLVHLGGERVTAHWPKEFVVAAVFALGSSIGVWTASSLHWTALADIALLIALFTLNCVAVDCWEWQSGSRRAPHPVTLWAARHFLWFAGAIALATLILAALTGPNVIHAAVLVSAGLLLIISGVRRRITSGLARMLADAALLSPLLLLAIAR